MSFTIEDVTFCITCFNRPKELNRILKSISSNFIDPKVLVVCDSKNQKKERKISKLFPHYSFIFTDYDIGLSKKRNILMNHCKTRLFCLLEEDFIFEHNNGISLAIESLNSDSVDFVGGRVDNIFDLDMVHLLVAFKKIINGKGFNRLINIIYRKKEPINHYGNFEIHKNKLFTRWNSKSLEEVDGNSFDIYPNFFLCTLDLIKKIDGWQPDSLKNGEHGVFFARLFENEFKGIFLNEFKILHRPKKRLFYLKKRLRKSFADISNFTNFEELNF